MPYTDTHDALFLRYMKEKGYALPNMIGNRAPDISCKCHFLARGKRYDPSHDLYKAREFYRLALTKYWELAQQDDSGSMEKGFLHHIMLDKVFHDNDVFKYIWDMVNERLSDEKTVSRIKDKFNHDFNSKHVEGTSHVMVEHYVNDFFKDLNATLNRELDILMASSVERTDYEALSSAISEAFGVDSGELLKAFRDNPTVKLDDDSITWNVQVYDEMEMAEFIRDAFESKNGLEGFLADVREETTARTNSEMLRMDLDTLKKKLPD